MILGAVHSMYKWTSKGRKAYHTQWSFLWRSEDCLVTVEAGHNAVRRSVNTSWFEWLEGLLLSSGTGPRGTRGR